MMTSAMDFSARPVRSKTHEANADQSMMGSACGAPKRELAEDVGRGDSRALVGRRGGISDGG
jgi:hypothetical protein